MTTLLRAYSLADHPMLEQWWNGHGWPAIPRNMIPPFAWIVESLDGTGRAFACAYMDNGGTGIAMLEWIVTNPANTPRESFRALDTLLPFMRDYLRDKLDYPIIMATCRQPALSRILEKHQFQRTDEGVTHHLYVPT